MSPQPSAGAHDTDLAGRVDVGLVEVRQVEHEAAVVGHGAAERRRGGAAHRHRRRGLARPAQRLDDLHGRQSGRNTRSGSAIGEVPREEPAEIDVLVAVGFGQQHRDRSRDARRVAAAPRRRPSPTSGARAGRSASDSARRRERALAGRASSGRPPASSAESAARPPGCGARRAASREERASAGPLRGSRRPWFMHAAATAADGLSLERTALSSSSAFSWWSAVGRAEARHTLKLIVAGKPSQTGRPSATPRKHARRHGSAASAAARDGGTIACAPPRSRPSPPTSDTLPNAPPPRPA